MTKGLYKEPEYKSSYNIENFSLDIMTGAIKEFFGGRELSFEDDLAYKLDRARRSIEDFDTWNYEVTWEELIKPEPVQIQTSWGWITGMFPSVLYQDTHVNMHFNKMMDDDLHKRFELATLRKRKNGK